MVGSSSSIADANVVINTAVAEVLRGFADELGDANNFTEALHTLIQRTIREHKRIIFNGNGYDDAWLKEAERRGLGNHPTTPDALEAMLEPKNKELLISHKVLSDIEITSRYDIKLENYAKTVAIEANTMIDMAKKLILPGIEDYIAELSATASAKTAFDAAMVSRYEKKMISSLSQLVDEIDEAAEKLECAMSEHAALESYRTKAYDIRDRIIPLMNALRKSVDAAEGITAAKYWPMPVYADLLFGVR